MHRYIDELQLLQAIRLAVVATDAAGVVTFANEAASEVYGAEAPELLGRDVVELFGGRDPAGQAAALDLAAVLAGSTWSGDLTVRLPDGAERLAAVSATRVLDGEGTVSGAVVVAEDLTEVREAEAVAAASEQRLRLAHEAAELGSWHWDIPGGTTVWDEQLEAIYGMPPGGFGGSFEAWQRTIHPDDHDRVMAVVQEALDARSSYVLRNRIFWPDGTMRWIEAHGRVTVDADGDPTGTIGCVRDVTERVVLQERQADAAARALLLQDVTAALSGARTLEQVHAVVRDSLERVADIVPPTVELRVPEDLSTITNGSAFVARSQGTISHEDAQLLDTLASQCAITSERARLNARTADIADQLQSSLAASPLPHVEHFELAAHYAPGGDELEHVGGDWYDAVHTPSGRLALVVGDVMGRGVPAATTMIRVRAGIRGLLTANPSPAAVLTIADQLMTRDAPDQFVTAAAVLVDPATGAVTVCNAGHVPVVLVHPDGSSEELGRGTGVPLGVVDDHARTVVTGHLRPGGLLVLVTDGVVESRTADLDQGIARLKERAADLREKPLDGLVAALADLADTTVHDDVTVLAARLR
jgi:PAS domain S-box-containing protein